MEMPAGYTPNPGAMFQAFNAFHLTAALKGAIELDLFTLIDTGAATAAEIAKRANASERGVRIVCDFLTVTHFLTKKDGAYGLTPDSAFFLSKQSPAYMGSAIFFLAHPQQMAAFDDFAAVIRKGGSVLERSAVAPDHPFWVDFARNMAPMSAMGAAAMAGLVARPGVPQKVLDIASGPGAYGIEVGRRNREAHITGADWKSVVAVSAENAAKAGLADRYSTIAGDIFTVDLGRDYDWILLPNILHHFDPETNVKLLRRMRAALKPGGAVATTEFVPNPDRVSPPAAATFSLVMLAETPSGDAYTLAELEEMFRKAGFGPSTTHEIPPAPQTLIITEYGKH